VTRARTILIGIYSRFAAWNIPASYVERLRETFPEHRFLHAHSDQEALALIPDADVAFMFEVRPEHLAAARQLKWIHCPAAGVTGMLFPAMIESPVLMSNSRGISADTIAEHVIAVTLVMFRKLRLVFMRQAERTWALDEVLADPPIRTIAGSEVLVVGLGAIGMATARRMSALDARVTAIRRTRGGSPPDFVECVGAPEDLLEFLPSADVVVVAAPQTPETAGLIGARELAAMRRDSLLVNVSRGSLVDERALSAALSLPQPHRTIGAAALDVFEFEPLPPDSGLWGLPNVLITPHMSGFSADRWDRATELFAVNLRRFEAGQPLLNVVDKVAGY
jgi:phosphoglycerate dehydrogenase-like enzyme